MNTLNVHSSYDYLYWKVGYRHIDCAYGYGNETEVGKALEYGLKELKIPRKVLQYD